MNEQDYQRGYQAALRTMLRMNLANLTGEDNNQPLIDLARARLERAEAISMLRQVCEEFGDNDWEDNFYLPDIIEKHLWRNLESKIAIV